MAQACIAAVLRTEFGFQWKLKCTSMHDACVLWRAPKKLANTVHATCSHNRSRMGTLQGPAAVMYVATEGCTHQGCRGHATLFAVMQY
jgi:hypothetical protein